MTNGQDRVDDDEELYRRVLEKTPAGQVCFHTTTGKLVFSQAAFNDPQSRPSVDRARLCGANPHSSRRSQEDGVVMLVARRVRELGHIQQNNENGEPSVHVIDILPAPVDGNDAHAVITTQPPLTSGSAFKRLKESLARLATDSGWHIEPGTDLPAS